MRKILIASLLLSVFVVGCSKNQDTKTSTGTKTDTVKTKETKTETTQNKTETTVKTETKVDDNNIDALIDSYEKNVSKYIETSGKMKKGPDAVLTAELSDLSAKQIDLVGKIEHEKSNMTAKQLEKYTAISVKLANATK